MNQAALNNITVGIRVRPPLQREIVNGVTKNCVAVSPNNQIFVSLADQPVVLKADGQIPDGVAAYAFD